MKSVSKEASDQIFTNARTHSAWHNQPVTTDTLHRLYDLYQWAPTAANSNPARIVFVTTPEAKEKLVACVDAGNVKKILEAPVCAIIAHDLEFYEKLPKLFPHADARSWFANNKELIETTAFRNSSMTGAYLMLAARSLGMDCGPMSGFDNAKVDRAFFSGSSLKSNFLCNLGYGDESKLFPRLPRLTFDEACKIV